MGVSFFVPNSETPAPRARVGFFVVWALSFGGCGGSYARLARSAPLPFGDACSRLKTLARNYLMTTPRKHPRAAHHKVWQRNPDNGPQARPERPRTA